MDKKKQEYFRKLLIEKRTQILDRTALRVKEALEMNREDLVDESDHAAALIQQGMAMEVQERDRLLLRDVERALAKLEQGVYGFCEDTEEPIDEGRLEAQPWTRFSVEAAEKREQQRRRFAR